MKVRGFETVSAWADKNIRLPERKTAQSAGYDIEAAASTTLLPGKVTIVPTGLKAYMQSDEYLALFVRSGTAIKCGLMLVNGTGIIDADYYNNADNEGHIMVALYNTTDAPVSIEKGDRVAQGIFLKYLTVDDDAASGVRVGGVGSTGVK